MTVPAGTASLVDIQTEFGGSNPIDMTEYYSGATTGYVTASNYSPASPAIPTSGAISIDNFRGKTKSSYGVCTCTTTPTGPTTINRGSQFTFTVSVTNTGTYTFYYTFDPYIASTIDQSDFASNISGSITITSSNTVTSATQTTEPKAIGYTQAFIVNIRTGSTSGPIIATSPIMTLNSQTYTPTGVATSLNRGDLLNITATGTNVPSGAVIDIDIVKGTSGLDPVGTDFTSGLLTTQVAMTSNVGKWLQGLTIKDSASTHFIFQGRSTVRNNLLFSTAETALTVPTFVISTSYTSLNRNQSFQIDVTTSNISNGAVMTALIVQTAGTVSTADFTDSLLTHNITISSNTAYQAKQVSMSWQTGTNTFQVQLKYNSTVLATSATATLKTATVDTIDFKGATSVTRGSGMSYRVLCSNIQPGTTLYVTPQTGGGNDVVAADFTDGILNRSATTDVNSDISIDNPIIAYRAGIAAKTLIYSVRHTSVSGPIGATTVTGLTIPQAYITFTWSPTSINNLSSATFSISITNINISTVYYSCSIASSSFCSDVGNEYATSYTGSYSVPMSSNANNAYSMLGTGAGKTFTYNIYADASRTILFDTKTLTSVAYDGTSTNVLSKTGGTSTLVGATYTTTASALSSYPISRTFSVTAYAKLNSQTAYGNVGTVSLVVAAGATSGAVTWYNTPLCTQGPGSVYTVTTLAGMVTKTSNTLTNTYW